MNNNNSDQSSWSYLFIHIMFFYLSNTFLFVTFSMFFSYVFRSHSWLSVKNQKYAISTLYSLHMNIELNILKNLNEKIKIGFFMNWDNFDYCSIKALKITFANFFRSALFYEFIASALNIRLIKSMQSEIIQTTANDMKNCISQSVNEIKTKLALNIRDEEEHSKIYEKYKLTLKLSNEFTLNVLSKKFIIKMNNWKFIWTAMKLKNSFKLFTQLYFRVLKWTNITIEENNIIIKVSYLNQYASVFLFLNVWKNWRGEVLICAHWTKTENWNATLIEKNDLRKITFKFRIKFFCSILIIVVFWDIPMNT